MPVVEYVGEVFIRQIDGVDYPISNYQQDLIFNVSIVLYCFNIM